LFVLAISKLNMYVTFYVFQFYLERGAKDIINQSTLAVACVGLVSACLRVMSFCSGTVELLAMTTIKEQSPRQHGSYRRALNILHSPFCCLSEEVCLLIQHIAALFD
jgi:hypothetical protein